MTRWALPGLGLLIAVTSFGFAGHVPTKDPKFKLSDTCTYLTASAVRKTFGAPGVLDPTNRGNPLTGVCDYLVGRDGAVVAIAGYPSANPTPGQNAVDQIETQQAQAQALGVSIEQVPLGRHAYIDLDHSDLGVAATTKFGFHLRWDPPTNEANPPTPAVVNQRLVSLGKLVISRSAGH